MSEVNALGDHLFAVILERYPLDASMMGLPGDDTALVDHSEDGEQKYAVKLEHIGAQAEALQPKDFDERITKGIILHEVRTQLADIASRTIEFAVSANLRAPVPGTLAFLPRLPMDTPERRAAYLQRLKAMPGLLETVAERHRKGIGEGRTPVAHLVEQAIELMDNHLANLDAFDVAEGAADVTEEVLKPAIEKYREVLENEVLPHGRDTEHAGLCWVPGGDEIYRSAIRNHTTEDLDPEELHQTGIRLIEDLKQEFETVANKPCRETFHRIRTDETLRHTSGEDMLEAAHKAVAKAEAAAPQWFRTMPEQRCAIKEAAPSMPAHVPPHYLPAAMDGSRPGTYFVNTKAPRNRLRIEDEATAFHEAVPGHHFEHAKKEQLTDVPMVRRKAPISVFGEGWGLYCERLADEMGLYSDDESRLGMLTMDAMRAGRLVVDTGLHAKGWSRQQAIDYLTENTPMPAELIVSEVDRYLAEPGQALAYMVGRLKIQELRRKAEKDKQDFDIRDFHEVVLGQGRLTLTLLDELVTAWIAER